MLPPVGTLGLGGSSSLALSCDTGAVGSAAGRAKSASANSSAPARGVPKPPPMLAYRHAFHAGNHADVLKHVILMLVLRHLAAKDKGFRFVDTHAGAGGYSLLGR